MMRSITIAVVILASFLAQNRAAPAAPKYVTCYNRQSPCFTKMMKCPSQCPSTTSTSNDPKAKVCYVNCNSPVCAAECKRRKPNCNGPGSACLDPRFIGGDGVVFYFHGRKNEHFALVSDAALQINARFIGLRPEGRHRDYTWIQALGFLFGSSSKAFSLEATPASTWNDDIDHLRLSFAGEELQLPEKPSSFWQCAETGFRVERTAGKNSVVITIPELAEIWVNVVPVTKEDDRVHKYQIPANDCFAHLEVQFRFYGLSPKVEGVLGRTYRLDFENPAKPGVAMPVLGGEDRYRTTSLLAADCGDCGFFGGDVRHEKLVKENTVLDCSGNKAGGNGIVCRK